MRLPLNIYDFAGIRIIYPFVDDIYMLADCIIRQDDVKLIIKKDYIAAPKENGYRSLHLLIEIPIYLQKGKRSVKVEIQFRTIAMEFWANLEHRLRYKKHIDKKMLNELSNELSECAEMCVMLDLKMKNIHDCIENSVKTSLPKPNPVHDINLFNDGEVNPAINIFIHPKT
jgi:putative GTP pyrophosphokinase